MNDSHNHAHILFLYNHPARQEMRPFFRRPSAAQSPVVQKLYEKIIVSAQTFSNVYHVGAVARVCVSNDGSHGSFALSVQAKLRDASCRV